MKRTILLFVFLGLGWGHIFSWSINLKTGLFVPFLQSDLWEVNMQNLTFNKSDMSNLYYGAEYEVFINRYTSISLEIGRYTKSINTQYKDYTHQDDSPIFQNISLHITPIESNVKLYPLGHRSLIAPYFGVGIGLYAWTYQQYGDFIIFPEANIREDEFAETRTFSFGFNGRAGMVFRFHPSLALAIEGKYQYLRGRLSGYFEGFDLLDLGGFTATFGVNAYL